MENKERKKRFNQEVSDLKCNEQLNSQFEKGDTVVVEGELLAKVLKVYKYVVKVEISDGTNGNVSKEDLIIVKKAI